MKNFLPNSLIYYIIYILKEVIKLVKVIVDKEFGLDAALREFKKKVNKAGILYECRKREYFMTPAELAEFKRKNKFKKK